MRQKTTLCHSDRLDSLSAYEMEQVKCHAIYHEGEILEIGPTKTHTKTHTYSYSKARKHLLINVLIDKYEQNMRKPGLNTKPAPT